ncbi:hypothetical protein DRQ36_07275 [bacterium]|nr:MAG: hypothetical protein DRQ36_07275 [bacterium]
MKRLALFFGFIIIALSLSVLFAKGLEIVDVDFSRIGVKIPHGVPDDIRLREGGDSYPFDMMSPLDGEFGWVVHCRLDTGAVDIVFCIDSTGSMGGEIAQVRSSISGLISALDAAGYDYRLGAVTYGDGTNVWDFDPATPGNQTTSNSAVFTSGTWLGGVGASGGADGPEQMLDCMADAITEIDWRPEALHILIGFTDYCYCQIGDGCTGYCNPGGGAFASPATETDVGVQTLITSTGTVVFMATKNPVYSSGCASYTSPVPPHPPWTGTQWTGWYQRFAYVSSGKWYDMDAVAWSTIFADVSDLISTFFTISIEVTNNTGSTISPVQATIDPGACITILSSATLTTPSIAPGDTHLFIWRIDYDSTCTPGPMLCFDIYLSGGGYADTAIGCLYMEDCQCAGPVPTVISPLPCGVWSACDYQEIIIEFVDDDVGTNPSTIQLMVDSVLYTYPTHMVWTPISTTVGRLTFTPPTPWIHGNCIDYWVVRADDWNGCPKVGDAYCWFCMDLEPPEEISWSPTCGTFLYDTFVTVQVGIEDWESGINILGLYFTVNGTPFYLGAGPPTVDYTGSGNSGTASIEGTLNQLGLAGADSAVICLNVCDNVSSTYCGPNCAQYCCTFYLNEPPMAEFVYPDSNTWVACDPFEIRMHLWDDAGADIDPASVIFNVNGIPYNFSHPWLTVTTDSLIFAPPPGSFFDGDIIRACLTDLMDLAGASCEELPICLIFSLDYSPPAIFDIFPPPDTTVFILPDSISFDLFDSLSGVNPTSITVTVQGNPVTGMITGDSIYHFMDYIDGTICLAYGSVCTIEVCVHVGDLPDYCGPNELDTCWYWYYERSGPAPSIIFPEPFAISACEDSGIVIRIDSTIAAVDSNSIVLTILRSVPPAETYRCSDAELTWLPDTSLLWFHPGAGYWYDPDSVLVCLDSVTDIYGTPAPGLPMCWEFYTDFTPPVFWDMFPPLDTIIADATPTISVFLYDSMSGVFSLDIITIITVNGGDPDTIPLGIGVTWDEITGLYVIDPALAGIAFSDSDTVVVCVEAYDQPDYCDPNAGDTCWSFIVSLSGPVPQWVQYSPESWVACDTAEQFAVATIIDPDGVDPATIIITVNGDTSTVDSSEVTFADDTLLFDPIVDFWLDTDTVEFCIIEALDFLGNPMGDIYCWSWLMDLSPPVFWSEMPYHGELLADSLAPFSIRVFDSLSGLDTLCLEFILNDTITLLPGDPGVYWDTSSNTFSFDPVFGGITWGDWDTVSICVNACDLPDYCGPNTSSFCWEFYVHLMGPEAEIVTPLPGQITSCYDQCITIRLWDDDVGVDPATIIIVVEGDTFIVDDSILTYTATPTETTLTFCPIPAGIFWVDSQDVHVELIAADDTLGNPLQTPLDWTFWVDLLPPQVESWSAGGIDDVCGDTVFTTRPNISFDLWDNLSGVDTARMVITMDDSLDFYWGDPGISGSAGVITVATGSLVPPLFYRGGDSVYICVYVEDTTDICADNFATYCCRFYVMPGGPSPTNRRPLNETWSACTDEYLDIEIYDDDGTIDTSIIVTVNRSASGPAPGLTTLYYDSPGVTWVDPNFRYDPPVPFADPETVDVCVMQAWDPVLNPMSPETLCWVFMMDQTAPFISGADPIAGAIVDTRYPVVSFDIDDIQSGLNSSSVNIQVTGSMVGTSLYDLSSGSVTWTPSPTGGLITWDPFVAGIMFTGGETVEICVTAGDLPDYCAPNELDTCWEFSIETGGPLAEIRRVWPDSISACDPEYILIRLWDDDGVVETTIELEVDGTTYTYPDHISYDHITEILRFDPLPPFDPVDIIRVRLLAAEDSLGNPLDSSAFLDWTFYVDRVSPETSGASPVGDIHTTHPLFDLDVWDTLAGVNPDSILLTIDAVDFDIYDAAVTWTPDPSGLGGHLTFDPSAASPPMVWYGGDTVEWCVYLVDLADDYADDDGCMPNSFDTCWTFQVVPGGPAGYIHYPQNGWYVACDPDSIIMSLTDTEHDALIEDSITVVIARSSWGLSDTIEFTLDSTELTYDPLTGGLWYHPIPPFADAETIFIEITGAMDTLYNDLEEGDWVTFYLDFSPPYITSISPSPEALITDIQPHICVGLADDMSGIDLSSVILTVDATPYDISSAGIHVTGDEHASEICLYPEDIGLRFWGGDTVEVCIESYDSPDTCGPNAMDSCWHFYIAPGGPVATPVNPGDSTISACDPEFIELTITDPDGIDDTTIVVSVYRTGPTSPPPVTVYHYDDGGVTWSYPDFRIDPVIPFADGETVTVCIDSASDPIGNELSNPHCWDFFMDLSVYAAWGFAPTPGSTIRTRLPVISAFVWDSISGLDYSSFEITIGGTHSHGPYSLFGDEPCVVFDELTGEITITPIDCGIIWSGGDYVTITLWGEDTPTDIRSCAPNETTYVWDFYVAPGGPEARIVTPLDGWYCACEPQGIVMKLWDEDGVDTNTIELIINGVTYHIDDPQLSYNPDDSVLYFEPSPNFPDGQPVHVELVTADDWLANPLETPLDWTFYIDRTPPTIDFYEPTVMMTRNRQQKVVFTVKDNGSGIDESSFELIIDEHGNHHIYDYSDLEWNIVNTGPAGEIREVNVTYRPLSHGVEYTSGDTVRVHVYLCDDPDTCGPNCNEDSMEFMIEPDVECLVFPNPFTPNGDMINEVAIFNYPFMFSEKAELVIYTVRNVEVFRREIDMTSSDIVEYAPRCWNGKYNDGTQAPEGLYIYLIIKNGEIICNGTVVLAR